MIEELQRDAAARLSAQTRESLATEAFGATARYDAAISRWFAEREEDFPNHFVAAFEKVLDLSYGENPHQRAAYYEQVGHAHAPAGAHGEGARQGAVLQQPARPRLGPPPAARVRAAGRARSSSTTTRAACAVGETLAEAYERALACDPQSAYGGVVVLNREVDARRSPSKLNENFVELLFAPGYEHEAIEILRAKPNMRIIEDSERRKGTPGRARPAPRDAAA